MDTATPQNQEVPLDAAALFAPAPPTTPTPPATSSPQDLPARQSYPDALKLEAVLAVIDKGMSKREVVETFNIASVSTLKKWLTAYRKDGQRALVAKKRGRPMGCSSQRYSVFDPLNYQASHYLHVENARLVGKLGGRG